MPSVRFVDSVTAYTFQLNASAIIDVLNIKGDSEGSTLGALLAFLGGTLSRLQQGYLLTVSNDGRDHKPAPHKLTIHQP